MNPTELMISAQKTSDVVKDALAKDPPNNLMAAFCALQGLAIEVVIQLRSEDDEFFTSYKDMEDWLVMQAKIALQAGVYANSIKKGSPN